MRQMKLFHPKPHKTISDLPENLSSLAHLGASQLTQISYVVRSGQGQVGVWPGLGFNLKISSSLGLILTIQISN